jgi:hypothetical protein
MRAAGSYGTWAAETAKQEGVPFIDRNEIVAKRAGGAGVDAALSRKRLQGYLWYLDNEPWNQDITNYTFNGNTYADECLHYGQAIKKEFPDARLICNPTRGVPTLA